MESEPSPNAILNFWQLNNAFQRKSYQHDRLSVQKNRLIILEKNRTFTITVPNQSVHDKMTDFQYIEGEYLERGQTWSILENRPVIIYIQDLFSTREIVRVQTRGQYGTTRCTDLSWSTFLDLYTRGYAQRYESVKPIKRLPPHSFL